MIVNYEQVVVNPFSFFRKYKGPRKLKTFSREISFELIHKFESGRNWEIMRET